MAIAVARILANRAMHTHAAVARCHVTSESYNASVAAASTMSAKSPRKSSSKRK